MDAAIGLYDEGVILFGGRRVMDGDLIYRDFYSNYGPGQFYTLAALFKLLSPSILVERLWDDLVRSLSVAGIFLIVVRSTRSILAALGTAAVCMVWLGSFGFTGTQFFLPSPPLSPACCACCPHSTPAPRRGPCWPPASAWAWLFCSATTSALPPNAMARARLLRPPGIVSRRADRGSPLCRALRCRVAFATAPVICAFIAHGAIRDLFFEIVTYPSIYYYKTRSLPFPGQRQIADNPAEGAVYLPLVLVAFASGVLVLGPHSRQTRSGDPTAVVGLWAQIALIAMTLLYFAKGITRVSVIHMSLAIGLSPCAHGCCHYQLSRTAQGPARDIDRGPCLGRSPHSRGVRARRGGRRRQS